MRRLILLTLCALSLNAAPLSLTRFLDAAASSETAAALQTDSDLNAARRRGNVLSEGIMLGGELDYADAKQGSRREAEYHLSVEKTVRFGDSDAYLDAVALSADQEKQLRLNRFKADILETYIRTCALGEKIELLTDAHERNRELTALISAGVAGGEFDRSALLRSELVTEEFQLRLENLQSRRESALQRLLAASGLDGGTPLCRDLPARISVAQEPEAVSLLYRRLESDITAATALSRFQSTPLPSVTLGTGYDEEMDVRRGRLFVQLPLTAGSRLENDRETARLGRLAAKQNLRVVQNRMRAEITAYRQAQETRRRTLRRLNDVLIPKAYESTVLLQERFIGSEGSYLAYIESQKALFELLLRGVDTRSEALLANAGLYRTLGIDPQKDLK